MLDISRHMHPGTGPMISPCAHALNPEGLDLQFKSIQRSLKSRNLCCISFTNCHLGKVSRFGAPIPALLKQNVLLQFGDPYEDGD